MATAAEAGWLGAAAGGRGWRAAGAARCRTRGALAAGARGKEGTELGPVAGASAGRFLDDDACAGAALACCTRANVA